MALTWYWKRMPVAAVLKSACPVTDSPTSWACAWTTPRPGTMNASWISRARTTTARRLTRECMALSFTVEMIVGSRRKLRKEGAGLTRRDPQQLVHRYATARRLPPVLLLGETGTGKSLIARTLHEAGPRARRPFVDVACPAIPETLMESQMFGFERGAFTDAREARPGLF